MHLRAAQQSLAMIGIKRDKKQGRVVLLEDEIQTWRGVGHLLQRTDPYNTTRKRR